MRSPTHIRPNLVAVIPGDRELQIDLDSKRDLERYHRRLKFFRYRLRAYSKLRDIRLTSRVTRSRNGKWHATVRSTQRFNILERITMQILLGSDPKRETFNYFRYLNESRFPVLFFERGRK